MFTNNTFYTSFFTYKNYFQGFFLPDDYSLDPKTLQQKQSQDPDLRTVYSWLTRKEKPKFLTPLITGTPFLHAFYKRISHFFKDDSTNLISLYTTKPILLQEIIPVLQMSCAILSESVFLFECLEQSLINFMNTLIQVSKSLIIRSLNITIFHILKSGPLFSYMIALNVNAKQHFNMKIQNAPTQSFSEHAPSFSYRISIDTKGAINSPSHKKYCLHVVIDAFSHFVVTVPFKTNNAKTTIKTLLHHWIIKFGPPLYLVTDRGSIKKWHTFVHLWELDVPLEQPILLGQMALSKYRSEILDLIYVCSFTTLLKIGHSKFTCMLTHTTLNLFQNSMFLPMKLFCTHNPGYNLLLI